MSAAHGAIGILPQLQLAELHPQRIENQEPADEGLTGSDNQLEGFVRLNASDDPRQHAEHPAFRAAWHQSGRRRLGIQAAIARTLFRRENRRLTLEAEDTAV